MKLATLRDGSRDGQLAVVSRDLSQAHFATGIAGTLRAVLDDWNFLSPQLEDLATTLNQGKARHAFAFDPRACLAPLPRAGRWLAADADGALHLAAGDDLLGPTDAPPAPAPCTPALAVVTGEVAAGATPQAALEGVRLLMLVAAWPLADGAPWHGCAPLAVTPDELGPAWQGGRAQLTLQWRAGTRRVHSVETGGTAFGALIARAAQARRLRAGSVVAGAPLAGPDAAAGEPMQIDALGPDGQSVFGAIAPAPPADAP